jgi:hypothetical protein
VRRAVATPIPAHFRIARDVSRRDATSSSTTTRSTGSR